MAAVALLRETPTALLVRAHVHPLGVVTAFHQDEDHQAMNVVAQGTREGGAVVPGAIQCGLADPAR